MKEEIRRITFGKYKDKTIIELIVTHIGYIMWCLNNVRSFYLTDEEQVLYDALAIGLIRDKCHMTFPIEGLKDFIKDKESLIKLESPFINKKNGRTYFNANKANKKIIEIVTKYRKILIEETTNKTNNSNTNSVDLINYLSRQVQWCEDFLPYDNLVEDFDFFSN